MLITVDGADGVGKTTLAKRLAKELGFEYQSKPLNAILKIKSKNSIKYKIAWKVQGLIFNTIDSDKLTANFLCSTLLSYKKKFKNKNAVIDRGLLSSAVYNLNDKTVKTFDKYLKKGAALDLNILLTCSKQERIKRLQKRNDSDKTDEKVLKLDSTLTENYAKSRNMNCIIIDTTNKNEEQVFQEALQKVKQNKVFKSMIKEDLTF